MRRQLAGDAGPCPCKRVRGRPLASPAELLRRALQHAPPGAGVKRGRDDLDLDELGALARRHLAGWWVARDADAALMRSRPSFCLAHLLDVSPDALGELLGPLYPAGRQSADLKRRRCEILGDDVGAGEAWVDGRRYCFLRVGEPHADAPSLHDQLRGDAPLRPKRLRGMPTMSPLALMAHVQEVCRVHR